MTREEAIEIMQINRDGVANMSRSEDRTKTLAALDMAIKALSQQSKTFNEHIKDIEVDEGYLEDWYISSVSSDDPPVWTESHIEELIGDFHLIPREREQT